LYARASGQKVFWIYGALQTKLLLLLLSCTRVRLPSEVERCNRWCKVGKSPHSPARQCAIFLWQTNDKIKI